ncbi:MAG: competence/damage-inducible protein A [Thermodesulfobacteriota bacterium]|nr:competence/damage-inducible protein A [Thermodesulfobacteriota bacterium]
MNAEVITIGNELISGSVVDTNSSFLAEKLLSVGIEVQRITSIGDNESDITDSLRTAIERSEVILVTGGLGPTPDDITAEVAAKAFGRALIVNETALNWVKRLFEEYGLEMPQNNEKQALMPENSELIMNPVGTACGFLVREKQKLFFFLPGVPRELVRMTDESVIPIIKNERMQGLRFKTTTLKIYGLGESKIAELIRDIVDQNDHIRFGFLPNYPENHIKITAKGQNDEEVAARISRMVNEVTKRLRDYIFGKDDMTMETVVGELLRKNNHTIAVAESCTGGLISQRLTNISGSSDYLKRGIVAYSNQAKRELLHVSSQFIDEFGAVSEQVAEKMAQGARELGKTDLGLGVTGIAGPEGGTDIKPVGLVFISLADREETVVKRYNFPGDRTLVRLAASQAALDLVRRYYLS